MASHQIIVQVVFFKNQFHNLPGIFWSNIGIWWYLYDFRVWVEKTHHSTSAKNLWISLLHRGPRPDHSKARSNLGIAGDTTVTENHGHNMSHVSLRGEISTKCFDCFFFCFKMACEGWKGMDSQISTDASFDAKSAGRLCVEVLLEQHVQARAEWSKKSAHGCKQIFGMSLV